MGVVTRILKYGLNTLNARYWEDASGNLTQYQLSTLEPSDVGTNLTRRRVLAAATTNATSVKTTAGRVYGYSLSNPSAAVKSFKFYDMATAPTVGTSTPALTIVIPAGQTVSASFPFPIPFTTGIAYAITGLATDADTTAVAVNDVNGMFLYL
jgi:hypothetical protein